MPTDPLDPEFAVEGPTPKPGQAVQPTNLPAQIRRGQEEALQAGAEVSGVMDVRRVLSGETPWTEAIAGALPMMLGGPEERAAARAGELGMKELAERYPKVGPPILKDAKTHKPILGKTKVEANKLVDAGKAYWGKQLTPEAEVVQKARQAAQKDITAGNYTPYFNVSERSNVNPTRYPPYKSTTDILPAKPETIKKYMAMASNPAGVERLQKAYEHGLTLPNASNWYFMHQLEQEFIKEYGELGPEMFKRRVADALAATTGGADPTSNIMTASYGNYLQARGEQFPGEAHQVPFPIGGGKYGIMPNLKQYQKMLMEGGPGITAANPKRYNFSANILGEAQAGTIDEQMMRLFDPTKAEPEHYGPYQQVLNDLAQANGVDPRYFQEVAWSGAKSMIAKGGKGGEYVPKPLIQEYNEAIERTSRITGVSPAEVVRRGIVRAEMPLYGAAGVIGVGAQQQQQTQPAHPLLQIDPAAAAMHAGGPGAIKIPPTARAARATSHLIDTAIEDRQLSEETAAALGQGAQ